MKKFLWGLVAGLVALPVLGLIYIMTGFAPAAVADRPFPSRNCLPAWLFMRGLAVRRLSTSCRVLHRMT
jgi:hypothetical protein